MIRAPSTKASRIAHLRCRPSQRVFSTPMRVMKKMTIGNSNIRPIQNSSVVIRVTYEPMRMRGVATSPPNVSRNPMAGGSST